MEACIECIHRNVCLQGRISIHRFCMNYSKIRVESDCHGCYNMEKCIAHDNNSKLFICSHFLDRRNFKEN